MGEYAQVACFVMSGEGPALLSIVTVFKRMAPRSAILIACVISRSQLKEEGLTMHLEVESIRPGSIPK